MRLLRPLITAAGLLLAWELLVRLSGVPSFILPGPLAVFEALTTRYDILLPHAATTAAEIVAGILLGGTLGALAAMLLAASGVARRWLLPVLVVSQALPVFALAPLLVLWLGFGMWPKIVITALMVFFPVVVTAAEGFASVDRSLLELLRSVSAPRHQIFSRITLPHSLPRIMAGLKIGITLAVVGAIVGEWVGADSGLGYLLVYANTFLDSTLLFASLVLLVVIGVVLFMLIGGLERLLMPWQYRSGR